MFKSTSVLTMMILASSFSHATTASVADAKEDTGILTRACVAIGLCDTNEEKAEKRAKQLNECKQMALAEDVCLRLSESHPRAMGQVKNVIESLKSNLADFKNDRTSSGKLLFSTGLIPMQDLAASDSYWARGRGNTTESQMVPVNYYLTDSTGAGSLVCEQIVGVKTNCANSKQEALDVNQIKYFNSSAEEAISGLLLAKKFWNHILNIVLQGNRIVSFTVKLSNAQGQEDRPEYTIKAVFLDRYQQPTTLSFPLVVDFYEFSPTAHGLAWQVKLN